MRLAPYAPYAAALAAAVAIAGCSAGASSSTQAANPAATITHKAKAAKPQPCKLKTKFDYIIRDDNPAASVMAQEIGNVDLVSCTDSLTGFRATAGQAAGECTTIALASSNPGYDVNKVPAPRLRDVIESAGPGC